MHFILQNLPETLSGFVRDVAESMEVKHVDEWDMWTFGNTDKKGICRGCVAANYLLHKNLNRRLLREGVQFQDFTLADYKQLHRIELAIDYLRKNQVENFLEKMEAVYSGPSPEEIKDMDISLSHILSDPTKADIDRLKDFANKLESLGY